MTEQYIWYKILSFYQNHEDQESCMPTAQPYNHVKYLFPHPYTLRQVFDVQTDNLLYSVAYKSVHPISNHQ